MTNFPALPGIYRVLFLYLEPISTILPFFIIWSFPGAKWFFHQLIPTEAPVPAEPLDPRSAMTVGQLGNCYLLLGMISSLVFRAVRDAVPNDPAAQERIIGAALFAMAFADLTHIFATVLGLPPDLRYSVLQWNGTTHGNITVVMVLFLMRTAWFLGIGRKRYWYGQAKPKVEKAS